MAYKQPYRKVSVRLRKLGVCLALCAEQYVIFKSPFALILGSTFFYSWTNPTYKTIKLLIMRMKTTREK